MNDVFDPPQCNAAQVGRKRGPSSYRMHDPEVVFEHLALDKGDYFLDLGCGPGDYAIHASRMVGASGMVYALDSWPAMIEELTGRAMATGINNVRAMICDITAALPVANNSVDVCLLSMVLHIPNVARGEQSLFSEIYRVVKPGGRLAIIECKKDSAPHGPPASIRLVPQEREGIVVQYGFQKMGSVDLGYNEMMLFTPQCHAEFETGNHR